MSKQGLWLDAEQSIPGKYNSYHSMPEKSQLRLQQAPAASLMRGEMLTAAML